MTTEAPNTDHRAKESGVTLMRPTIVAALYLLNFVFGFSVIVGVILAYVWRADADTAEWERTHHTYLIRTFWISFVALVLFAAMWVIAFFSYLPQSGGDPGNPPAVFFILFFGSMLAMLLVAAWFCIRCILSLVKTGNREPMPNPKTWLF